MRRAGARGGGKWQQISWDEALDEMAERLIAVKDQHGPEALVGAVSSAFFSRGLMVALLMRSLGSPNWMINQDLCGGCRAVSDRITGLAAVGGEDVENTRCALIVGRNPSAADPVQWMALKRAVKNGAKVVVIDPAKTPASDLADLWLRPKLGTDAAIALAMIHVTISEGLYDKDFVARWCHGFDALEERAAQHPPERAAALSGVDAADIVRAARMYADGPSCFVSGHGIDAFRPGSRPSAPSMPWSRSAAIWTARAETCAASGPRAFATSSRCCTTRNIACRWRPSGAPSAPRNSRYGRVPTAGRWRRTTRRCSTRFSPGSPTPSAACTSRASISS